MALRSEKSEDMNTHTKVRLNIESDEEEMEEEEEEEVEQEKMQGTCLTLSRMLCKLILIKNAIYNYVPYSQLIS